ncbi:hypothetical protein WG8_5020 [Paenibacillus sp. Aloe-11]|nr:hypothetical protein WG8_5020 [Paenibacillus sp. Aloe-11]
MKLVSGNELLLDSGSANVSLNLDSTMAWVSSLNW